VGLCSARRTLEQEGRKNQKKSRTERGLVVWTANADVFNTKKVLEIQERIKTSDYKPDIIAISETRPKHCSHDIDMCGYKLEGYEMECVNTNGQVGRGMILYINCEIEHNFNIVDSVLEALYVELNFGDKKTMCFCSIYRSPNSDRENNDNMLTFIKELVNKNYSSLVIAGDFNLSAINWATPRCTAGENSVDFKFFEMFKDCYLTQHVINPTRGRGSDRPSLVDLVLTSNPECVDSVLHEAPLGKSDHAVIVTKLNIDSKTNLNTGPKRRYNKGDYNNLRKELNIDWERQMRQCEGDVEQMWQAFRTKLEAAVEASIPQTKPNIKKNSRQVPLDKKTLKKIKKKNRLWNNYTRTGDLNVYAEYCQIRNQTRRQTRKSKKNFERKLAQDVKNNPKKFWSYVNAKTKTRVGVPNLSKSGNEKGKDLTVNDQEKADILADFFSSVFTNEPDGSIRATMKETDHLWSPDLSEDAVKKLLSKINTVKSPGPDGIHPRVLLEAREIVSKPISLIFEASLKSGNLPRAWKEANITAIHKKGSKKVAGNYRPVSLTSVVCKTMETLIRDSLMDYLNKYNILSSKQFGFISGRSTVLQLITVLELWTEILDKGGCVDVIYCDFMKAFDKVPHRRLIEVLENYGVSGDVLSWIRNFLTNRRQKVTVNGQESRWHEVISGIPQGSVLGPILFVIYINSLPEVATNSEVFLFADDTKVFREILTEEDCDKLQKDIDNMFEWTQASLLRFHPDKCTSMRIGTGNKHKLDKRSYTMGPDQVELKNSKLEKDIGVFIDDNLTFDEHINNKVNKANSVMGLIRRTFEYLDERTFTLLYKALVRPHLEYANQVWAPMLKRQEIVIENVQRRATKLIPGFKEMSYEERLRKLNLPTLKYRRIRGDMIEMFKIMTHKYDERVSNFIEMHQSDQTTRGHQYKIKKQQVRLNVRKNSFVNRSVDSWNGLPSNVVNAPTVQAFEARLDKLWRSEPTKFNIDQPPPRRHKELTPEDLEAVLLSEEVL
jgi:hypothetical protein